MPASDRTIIKSETVKVATLATYHRNPRRGDTGAIAKSLAALGQYRPIVVNRGTHTGRTNEVLAGNHTLMAARDLGWETIDATWVDVDDDAARRIVVADNRLADLGDYDNTELLALLEQIDDTEPVGYDDDAIAELRRRIDMTAEPGMDEWPDDLLPNRDGPVVSTRTFTIPNEFAQKVDDAVGSAEQVEDGREGNSAGLALVRMAEAWLA